MIFSAERTKLEREISLITNRRSKGTSRVSYCEIGRLFSRTGTNRFNFYEHRLLMEIDPNTKINLKLNFEGAVLILRLEVPADGSTRTR